MDVKFSTKTRYEDPQNMFKRPASEVPEYRFSDFVLSHENDPYC